MPVITTTDELRAFCTRLSSAAYVTVDTEFMREKTYWPKLCLVQLAGPDEARAVDPLAEGIDLAPLFDLMHDPRVTKVFHAARQDLEIFHHLTGKVPAPMFDTQVAAMVCGFGESVGYETLVTQLAGGRIDKSSRFTDWSRRPLTEKQVAYALADVTHLRIIYEKLHRQLEQSGRASWLQQEMAVLEDPATYEIDPREAWRRIKGRGHKPRMLAILREVAAWREVEARNRDVPRNRILRDEALVEIAHHAPATVEDLARTRGLGRGLAEGAQGRALLEAVERGRSLPADQCPQADRRPDLPRNIGPVVDLLKVLLKAKCQQHDVAAKMVASAADVELLAAFGDEAGVPALSGWRREVFGADALRVRAGEIGFGVVGKKVKLIELN